MRDDYRAKSLVSPVEHEVYEFAGPIFHGPRCSAVVEYYETVCVTCEFNDGFKSLSSTSSCSHAIGNTSGSSKYFQF